jgi:hypothetical protein
LRRNRKRLPAAFALSPTEYGAWNRKRIAPQANCTKRIQRTAGTKPAPRRFFLKCSNLARGESMKDPVCIFECRRGFSFWSGRTRSASHAIGRV